MAATSISAITAVITGVAPDSGFVSASGDTCTITAPSNTSLDFSKLLVRVANEASGGGCTITLEAGGSTYSSIGQGDATVTLGTAATVIIGGKDFESARFLNASAQSLILTFTGGTTSSSIEAYQLPFGFTG